MRIPIPRWLVRASAAFEEWGNVPIWTRGRLQLRRLDPLIALLGVICSGYYGWVNGWRGAVFSLIAYVALVSFGLMLRGKYDP